jgi:hypothetical protein
VQDWAKAKPIEGGRQQERSDEMESLAAVWTRWNRLQHHNIRQSEEDQQLKRVVLPFNPLAEMNILV